MLLQWLLVALVMQGLAGTACARSALQAAPSTATGLAYKPVRQLALRSWSEGASGSGGMVGIASGSTASGSSAAECGPMQAWSKGASVYDMADGHPRGYGVIDRAGDMDAYGSRTWYIDFPAGQRITAISERRLQLALIPHNDRVPPCGLGQPIQVVLGEHKGKTGTTESKFGAKFTCKLEGVRHAVSFHPDWLHATAPPPADRTLKASSEELLTPQPLPCGELAAWLHEKERDRAAPIDLRLRSHSLQWLEVVTGVTDVDSMSGEDVQRLAYELPGSIRAAADGSKPDAVIVREGLRKAAAGRWKATFQCAQASKCGCPFALECRHVGSGQVEIWQTETHQFHDPTSAADLSQLNLDPAVEEQACGMLRLGLKPAQVHVALLNTAMVAPGATYSDARHIPSLAQLYALQKRLRREDGFGLTTDPAALAALAESLQVAGCIAHYKPYRPPCTPNGEGEPVVLIIQTPFQRCMLDQFGRRLVFLDSTGGTNKYGYPLCALAVQDEFGRGVPVGFMLTSSENGANVELFLRTLQAGAREAGDGTFKYGDVMIDKSPTEIAAVKELVATGDAAAWQLCYFHFLQDWERFVRSAESGVECRGQRNAIMSSLARLAHQEEPAVFRSMLSSFYSAYGEYPKVVARMKAAWEGCAEHWAWHGRVRILDLQSNTNNLVERCFGLIKYTDLNRNTQSTLHQLALTLLEKTVKRYMHNRGLMLAGRTISDQHRVQRRRDQVVVEMVGSGAVQVAPASVGSAPGLAWVQRSNGQTARVCVGDLSCDCPYSGVHMCVHIRAAAETIAYTRDLRAAAAAHLVAQAGEITVDEESGVCQAMCLADFSKVVFFRPRDGFCTCHGHALHRTCCHLLAAASLPAFAGEDLLGLHVEDDDGADGAARLAVKDRRTFQQPSIEPLGADEGRAELLAITAARSASAAAIKRGQSNVTAEVAELRASLAGIERGILSLPAGEQRRQCLQEVQEVSRRVTETVAEAGLPLTNLRAGKVTRRKNGRHEGQRTATALFPGRKSGGPTLMQQALGQQEAQQQAQQQGEAPAAFPTATKKGKQVHKVRGPTVPGNLEGTFIRNGAAHHRRPKSQRQQKRRRVEAATPAAATPAAVLLEDVSA